MPLPPGPPPPVVVVVGEAPPAAEVLEDELTEDDELLSLDEDELELLEVGPLDELPAPVPSRASPPLKRSSPAPQPTPTKRAADSAAHAACTSFILVLRSQKQIARGSGGSDRSLRQARAPD